MSKQKIVSVFYKPNENKKTKAITSYVLRIRGYAYKGKTWHDLVNVKMMNKKGRDRLAEFVSTIIDWNKLNRPIDADLAEKISQYSISLPSLYEKLVSLELLECETVGAVEEAIQAYIDQEKKVASTIKKVCDVWEEIADIIPPSTKLRDVNEKKVRAVHKALHSGKCSTHYMTGKPHSDASMKTRWSCITRVFDAAKRAGLITINPCDKVGGRKYAKGCSIRKKDYHSIGKFEHTYSLYERMPDIQMFLTQMYTIGSRPGEAWYYDRWEDIEWERDRPKYMNRHYCKTASDVDEGEGHRLGQVKVGIPKRMQDELIKYRDALLMWEVDYPHLFNHRNADCKPPVWDQAKKSFTGRIYCVRKFKYAYYQEAKLKGFLDKLPKALPTTLRASCSSHIFDIGGSRLENHYLKHDEKARQKHYCGPLSDRPEMFTKPEGNFYRLYDELFAVGTDAFYKKFNSDNDPLYDLVEEEERAAA